MKRRVIWLQLIMVFLAILLLASRCEYFAQPYFGRLMSRIKDSNAPDVAYMDVLRVPEYIREELMVPLDEVLEQDDLNDLLNDFDPRLLSPFQRDGLTYVCPRDFQTVALLVNIDMLEEVGLQPPTDWPEFEEAAAMLTKQELGVYGVGLTSNLWNWLPFLGGAGGTLLDGDGTQMTLDTDEAVEALKFYVGLYQAGYVFLPEEGLTWPPIESREALIGAFEKQQVAMIFGGNSYYAFLRERAPELNIQVVPVPEGPTRRATIAYAVGYGLIREGDLEAGPVSPSDLLRFTCSQDAMEIWAKSPIYMPPRQSLWGTWSEQHPEAAAFLAPETDFLRYQPKSTSFAAIEEFDMKANSIIASAMRGERTVEQALEMLQELGTEMLEQ